MCFPSQSPAIPIDGLVAMPAMFRAVATLPTNNSPNKHTRSCFPTIDRTGEPRDGPDCASKAGEHLVGLAVRTQWKLENLLFGWMQCHRTPGGGTVKQVLLSTPRLRRVSIRLLGSQLASPRSHLSLYELGRAVLCCTFPGCMGVSLTFGYRVHGSGAALWEMIAAGRSSDISRSLRRGRDGRRGGDDGGDELSRLYGV
jgi:hypothetical protein